MNGFFDFFRMAVLLLAVVFVASCSMKNPLAFMGKEKSSAAGGLVPLPSSGLPTTKDIRADVVQILMDSDDIEVLKRNILKLEQEDEASWTNKKTGNAFTVRAIGPISSQPEGGGGSRKIVIWGKKKGISETMVKTYRYYY